MKTIRATATCTLGALALAGTLASTGLHAQDAALTVPEPVNQEGREFPGFGQEGLFITRYTVKADGSTGDIEVVGGFTNPFAEQAILNVVKAWTFKPGTENGEAVDFYNQETVLRARLSEELAISPEIQENVDEVTSLVGERDYKKAMRNIDRLLQREVRTVFDYALLHEMKASVLAAQDQHHAALEASKIASMSVPNLNGEQEFLLTPEILESALRKRFLLAASLAQYPEALSAYEVLEERYDIPRNDKIHEQARLVRERVESPEPLVMQAALVENSWTHVPSRRIFTVADIDGKLNRIKVRCQRRNLELKYQENVDWTLPEAFGDCALDFEGRKGTTFTLYEFSE